jgi:hypothetical protein
MISVRAVVQKRVGAVAQTTFSGLFSRPDLPFYFLPTSHTPDHPPRVHDDSCIFFACLNSHTRSSSTSDHITVILLLHTYTQPFSVHLRSSELTMAETEYDDPKRIELLTALKEALNCDVSSTAWACLWLSDIDKLEGLVGEARRIPYTIRISLKGVKSEGKIVEKCKFITSHKIGSLILYRDSTIS